MQPFSYWKIYTLRKFLIVGGLESDIWKHYASNGYGGDNEMHR